MFKWCRSQSNVRETPATFSPLRHRQPQPQSYSHSYSNNNSNNGKRPRGIVQQQQKQRPVKRHDDSSHNGVRKVRKVRKPIHSASVLGSLGRNQLNSILSSSSSNQRHKSNTLAIRQQRQTQATTQAPSQPQSQSLPPQDDGLDSLCNAMTNVAIRPEVLRRQRKEERRLDAQLFATVNVVKTREKRIETNIISHKTNLEHSKQRNMQALKEKEHLQRNQQEQLLLEERAVQEHKATIERLRQKNELQKKENEQIESKNNNSNSSSSSSSSFNAAFNSSSSSSSSSSSNAIDNDPEHGTVAERVALRLRPFTTQETERINDTLSRNGNANEILVKEFKVEMTRKIMRDLSGLTWINDEIINYNMAMINARDTREMEKRMLLPHDETNPPKRRIWCAKSFLMTKLDGGSYKDVKRWAKKAKLGGTKNSIFDLWRMVVPINIGNSHWTSVHVDFKTKAILYLDSMGGGGQKYLNLVLNYLKDEHSAKIGTSLDESEWTMKSLGRTIPQQQNCSDCGMFTCTFATYATDTLVRGSGNGGRHGIPFEFGQQDMPYMRRRLALDILSKRLD